MSAMSNEPAVGPISEPVAPVVKVTLRERAKRLYARASTKTQILGLKAAEKVVRARSIRLLALEVVGALAAFHGIEGYSHRVAYLVLGAGIILAAERQ